MADLTPAQLRNIADAVLTDPDDLRWALRNAADQLERQAVPALIGASPVKYQWQQHPNPHCNTMHVSERLQRSSDGHDGPSFLFEEPEDKDREFIEELWSVSGIETIMTGGYECWFKKARLHDWSDIRPAVIEVFRRRYGVMEEVDEHGPFVVATGVKIDA
jgi:hypothetical protein